MTQRLRGVVPAVLVVSCTVALTGCADREPGSAPAGPASSSRSTTSAHATSSKAPSGAPKASPAATTTALPGMPVPSSVGSSPVDPARLRSLDDLPSAFECPATVTPIRIPAATPNPTATVPPAPEAVVCASSLADKEAVYLWYCPTAEAKLGALTAALAQTKYVHAGANWVAAGMVNPTMGSIGGEVYR